MGNSFPSRLQSFIGEMKTCIQCKQPADLHITYLGKRSLTEDEVQKCNICSECLGYLWTKHPGSQFQQTIQIEPAN